MRQRWFSPRALLLHIAVVVVATGCVIAGWWQLGRARSGNVLSYAYAVEWPAFAVVALVGWWQLIHWHDRPRVAPDDEEQRAAEQLPRWRQRRVEQETPELRAYNDYLRELAESGARKTWRTKRGD